MKKNVLAILVALITLSPKSFAAKRDLKVFNTLIRVGVQGESGMSKFQLGVLDVECSYSHHSQDYDCHLHDISANNGEGATIEVEGKKAKKLFHLLAEEGAISDNGMGRVYLSVASIYCAQIAEGVVEGDAAERTTCSTQIEDQK